MQPYVGRVLSADTYRAIVDYAQYFVGKHQELLKSRVRRERIRDCHGDLQLQHIYISAESGPSSHQFKIIDCIDFSDRFRCGDVAGEVAFLKMDMDAAGRTDLAQAFVTAYVRETADEEVYRLLPFYACYRACVRGKACAFQLDQAEVSVSQIELAKRRASSLFTLARSYIDTAPV
jgi:aminoglycoside phosphotransferase family enzyme